MYISYIFFLFKLGGKILYSWKLFHIWINLGLRLYLRCWSWCQIIISMYVNYINAKKMYIYFLRGSYQKPVITLELKWRSIKWGQIK